MTSREGQQTNPVRTCFLATRSISPSTVAVPPTRGKRASRDRLCLSDAVKRASQLALEAISRRRYR